LGFSGDPQAQVEYKLQRNLERSSVRAKSRELLAAVFIILIARSHAADLVSLLAPPAGTRVAVVLFQDLEWPDCASAFPIVNEAAKGHNVPVLIRDFPLPRHNWSFQAAVDARFFETQSQQLGDEFRGYILQNQPRILDEAVLRQYTVKFAAEHQVRLPTNLDPEGKLRERVKADFLLGQRVGLEHTPTVFVVSNGAVSSAIVGTVNRERLNQMIEQMQKAARPESPARPATKPHGKAG
jgi:protein-disulfide isomerase